MIDEHNLLSFSSAVAIVKITNMNLEKSLSTGKYIFIKVDAQWKVFRIKDGTRILIPTNLPYQNLRGVRRFYKFSPPLPIITFLLSTHTPHLLS